MRKPDTEYGPNLYQSGIVREYAIRFVKSPTGLDSMEIISRGRHGLRVVSRLLADRRAFDEAEVTLMIEILRSTVIETLLTTNGVQLALSAE